MNDEKGFTLVELIAVIVILGLILLIAIPVFQGSLNVFRDDYYKSMEDNVLSAGKEFFLDNRLYLPNKILGTAKVDLYTLNQTNYINELRDYNDNACSNLDSYVIVIRLSKKEYKYVSCIKCLDDDFDNTVDNKEHNFCSKGWLDETGFISTSFDTADDVYIYKGTSSESLSSAIKVYPHLVRCVGTDSCEEELYSVTAEGEDGINPISASNISSVDPNTLGTYEVEYSYEDSTITGNVIVYEHEIPKAIFSKGEDFDISYDPTSATEWANKAKVDLNYTFNSYDKDVFVSRYEMYKNGRWEVLCVPNALENGCYGIVSNAPNNELRLRFVDTKNRISKESFYILRVDGTAPTCTISGSVATCTDTGGSKITRTYLGTKEYPKASDFKVISSRNSLAEDLDGEEKGTYYFIVMDDAGNKSNAVSYTR